VSQPLACWSSGRVHKAPSFVQQLLPRLWHDRLETEFLRRPCVDSVLSLKGHCQQGRPRVWHDRLETEFFTTTMRGLGSSLNATAARGAFLLFRRDFPSWVTTFKRQNRITRENRVTHMLVDSLAHATKGSSRCNASRFRDERGCQCRHRLSRRCHQTNDVSCFRLDDRD